MCAVWLLVWTLNRRGSQTHLALAARPYQITGPFVKVRVADGYSLTDLRALFESIRNDPKLPTEALLLFDGSARTESLTEADVRARMTVFLDILRPHIAPVFAVIAPTAMASAAQAAQLHAAAAGVRVELFRDLDRARRWLSAFAPMCTAREGPAGY